MAAYNMKDTPRYYPYGSPESAGQVHLRLHEATKAEGIKLQGGNLNMTDKELMGAYTRAYSNPTLGGIKGELRTPNGKNVVAQNVSPAEAMTKLKE